MTRAYHEMYLSSAQSSLGDAFDYAVNACGVAGDVFVGLFVASSISKRMANGEPVLIVGRSGVELVDDIIFETTGNGARARQRDHIGRSPEYWVGWAIAYYQWFSGRTYGDIFHALAFDDLLRLYRTLHEADVIKFVDVAEERVRACRPDTNLKRIRTAYGCIQAQLASMSDVGLRSIQMYEQRNKDINKASVATVHRLAQALGCTVEDLMER